MVTEVMTKVMMVLDLKEEVAKQLFAVVWALVIGIWQEQVHNGINIIIVGNEIARYCSVQTLGLIVPFFSSKSCVLLLVMMSKPNSATEPGFRRHSGPNMRRDKVCYTTRKQ